MKKKLSQTRTGKTLTKVMLLVGVSPILIWMPQIMKVYETKNVESFSFTTISLYTLISALWLVYGIQQFDRPVILSGVFNCLSTVIIMYGMFLYG